MATACRHIETCRLCGGAQLETVLSLAPTPPANAFVTAERVDEVQALYPLDVGLCGSCAHVQLLDVFDPAALFEDYVYVTGTSPSFVAHFESYAADVIAGFGLAAGELVVDIGSNDGTLLRAFQAAGAQALGIEPAKAIARRANAEGIETRTGFFDRALAQAIRDERGPARFVTANNVFAHIDDLGGTLDGIASLLAPEGVFVAEFSYLADVVEKTLFDTIYHEHLDYHSLGPLIGFFEAHGLDLFDARRTPAHGGSLRIFAAPTRARRPIGAEVGRRIEDERRLGLDRASTFRRFGENIGRRGAKLTSAVRELRAEGKRVAGFGAPAKATTLLFHFGLGRDELDFIVDDSPWKQGLYSPGLHVPIVPAEAIAREKPDVLVILAWNFAAPIMAKHQAFRDRGGRFLLPLPEVRMC